MATRRGYDTNLAVAFLWPFKVVFVTIMIYVLLGVTMLGAAYLSARYGLIDGWENPPVASERLFRAEAARVEAMMPSHASYSPMPVLIDYSQRFAYWLFFKATSLHEAMTAYYAKRQTNEIDTVYIGHFIAKNADAIYTSMNLIQVYGLRIGVILAAMPLFMLMYTFATVDGFAERFIRRACAGRESADIHKIGRMSKLLGFAMSIMLYCCLPIELNPFWLIVPLAVVFTVATRYQWAYYKKYL